VVVWPVVDVVEVEVEMVVVLWPVVVALVVVVSTARLDDELAVICASPTPAAAANARPTAATATDRRL
jgi:hypothetical protein